MKLVCPFVFDIPFYVSIFYSEHYNMSEMIDVVLCALFLSNRMKKIARMKKWKLKMMRKRRK